MTVVSRRITATPARSASAAWDVIVDMVAPSAGPARSELQSIAGIASTVISDEALKSDACVVYGSGPRLRIYCVYNDDALSSENINESALTFVPTDEPWHMSLPCLPEDVSWITDALRKKSTHVVARAIGTDVEDEQSEKASAVGQAVVNREAFFRS